MEIISTGDETKTPNSEKKVLRAFAGVGDEQALVFHSVAWQGLRADRPADGEADLVICDGRRGILVVEVKGGAIEMVDGHWFSTSANGERHSIKNPFEQAKSSKHALLRYLRSIDPELARKASFAHAVAFPDVSCDVAWIGPDSPRAIILDREDISNVPAALERVFTHWDSRLGPNATERRRIRSLLAPTITIRRRLKDVIADTETELLRLTRDQIRAMEGVRRNRHLIILGGAGSGKTVLATERAKQLRAAGSRTLLVCFNRPLADELRRELQGTGVNAETYHTLCASVFARAKVKYPPPFDNEWWRTQSGEQLLEACAALDQSFDAVIVDEAQDFDASWLDALYCLLSSKDDSVFVICGDTHQELWGSGWRNWTVERSWPIYELTTNCRTTTQIGKVVSEVFGDKPDSLGAQGPEVVFHKDDIERRGVESLVQLVSKLIREDRVEPAQIAVIASSRAVVDALHQRFVDDVPFGPIGSQGVVADTVHRFKGLESPCVLVVLTSLGSADEQILKYVAYSRAKTILHVFAPRA